MENTNGIMLNDIHSQLNSTSMQSVETPASLEGLRAAISGVRDSGCARSIVQDVESFELVDADGNLRNFIRTENPGCSAQSTRRRCGQCRLTACAVPSCYRLPTGREASVIYGTKRRDHTADRAGR